jgi:hypothetical protein
MYNGLTLTLRKNSKHLNFLEKMFGMPARRFGFAEPLGCSKRISKQEKLP